jgi:two-component system LytT family response regulator
VKGASIARTNTTSSDVAVREHEIGPILRVVVADDERPARAYLLALLATCPDVTVVGEAQGGAEAIALIEEQRPDLAFLDLQMPEVDGLDVVRLLRKDRLPLVAFVTAFDEFAVRAFELNAIDYLLKPVDATRLRFTLTRAHDRLDEADNRRHALPEHHAGLANAAALLENAAPLPLLRRIPVRRRNDLVLVPVSNVASVVADGELLHITTIARERHTITYRLKDLEARLEPSEFIRLSRGTLVRVDSIAKVSPMPGATYQVALTTGQQFQVSRLRARVLRDQLLKL